MVFQRALQRELTQSAVGLFVALFAILLTTHLIRLLNEAAGGRLAPEAVAALLGFAALQSLPVLLSLTVFVAILLTLSRVYRDSEMVIWTSSGLPLIGWIPPILRFALPIVLVVALVSFFLSPWALTKAAEFRQNMNDRGDAAQISPGTFREASGAERVIFVESLTEDASHINNLFVSSMQHGRLGVMVAARGRQETAANGDNFMVLEDGRRYEVVPGTPEFRVLEFSRYDIRVETKETRGVEKTSKNRSTRELLRSSDRRDKGELLWRIGLPLSTLLLAVFAIPLSYVNPRAGRSANFIIAVLIFVFYNNLMTIFQSLVAQGRLSFGVGWWVLHALVLAAVPLFFLRRIVVGSFLRRVWR